MRKFSVQLGLGLCAFAMSSVAFVPPAFAQDAAAQRIKELEARLLEMQAVCKRCKTACNR